MDTCEGEGHGGKCVLYLIGEFVVGNVVKWAGRMRAAAPIDKVTTL